MVTRDRIKLEGEITEDGRLLVEIPPDAPRGAVEVWVQRARPPEPEAAAPGQPGQTKNRPRRAVGLSGDNAG